MRKAYTSEYPSPAELAIQYAIPAWFFEGIEKAGWRVVAAGTPGWPGVFQYWVVPSDIPASKVADGWSWIPSESRSKYAGDTRRLWASLQSGRPYEHTFYIGEGQKLIAGGPAPDDSTLPTDPLGLPNPHKAKLLLAVREADVKVRCTDFLPEEE